MLPNFPIGSRSNPLKELVLVDAITKALMLRRQVYAKVEDDRGLYKIFPDGEVVLLRSGRRRIRRKVALFSAEPRKRR